MEYHIYIDNQPTKDVCPTLDEAKLAASQYFNQINLVEIHTVNSMRPVDIWQYDYDLEDWKLV